MTKLVKKPKLSYAHARKALPVMSPKECVLFLGKLNLRKNMIKIRQDTGALAIVDTKLTTAHQGMRYPKVTWRIVLYDYLFCTLPNTCTSGPEYF